MALCTDESPCLKQKSWPPTQKTIDAWLNPARIFEITRTGTLLSLCGEDCDQYNPIQPPIRPLYPQLPEGQAIWLGGLLVALSLLLLITLLIPVVRDVALPFVAAAAIVTLLCGIALLLPQLAGKMTQGDIGEPLTLQGASIWPTILLRALGIVVSFSMIVQVIWQAHKNLYSVANHLQMKVEFDCKQPKKAQGGVEQAKKESAADIECDICKAWREYVCRGRWGARCYRAVIFITLIAIVYIMLCQIFNWPLYPARGEFVQGVYTGVTVLSLVALQLLIFFVLDATWLCLDFVSKLNKRTLWPPEARSHYEVQLGLTRYRGYAEIDPIIDDWIDLTFVRLRTECINRFISYPFIVIALLLLSRSTLFANYPPDAPFLITTSISLMVTFICALMLPHAADQARDYARRDIMKAIVRTKGPPYDERVAGQLEALLNRVNSLHEGAFRPFTEQPYVRALLWPLTTLGGIPLLEYFGVLGA
jgi:hypothetical protein